MIFKHRSITSLSLLITILSIFLYGCSSGKPPVVKEKKGESSNRGFNHLAENSHKSIIESATQGKLSAVLDVAVANFVESSTGERIEFSELIESELTSRLSKLESGKDLSIQYVEPYRLGKLYQSELKEGENQIDQKKLASLLNSNLLLTGTFSLINNETEVLIQVKVVDPRLGMIHGSSKVTIKASDLERKVLASFPAEVDKAFSKLHESVKKAKFQDMKHLIQKNWSKNYKEKHARQMRDLVQLRFQQGFEGLERKFVDVDAIQAEKDQIAFLSQSYEIKTIGFLHGYSKEQQRRINKARKNVQKIEAMMKKGLKVTTAFIAQSEDNEPLDFDCDSMNEDELDLEIGSMKFSYKNGSCNIKHGRHHMVWLRSFVIFPANWQIRAIEREMVFSDNVLQGHVKVTKNHMLRLYYDGTIELPVSGSVYTMSFTRL